MTPSQSLHPHLAALRRIEQEEYQRARLERLRELHADALRRHGLTGVQLPGTITAPEGYVLLESE